MNLKIFYRKNLPIILFTLTVLFLIPLLVWAVSQRQLTKKEAAESLTFPQVDLNGDGVINNLDLKIYRERFTSPKP